MSEEFYDRWAPTIDRVSKRVAHDYPEVEAEDLFQDLFVKVLEAGWESPDNPAGCTSTLIKVAQKQAWIYRTQHLTLSPQYNYRVSEVRRVLEKVFDREQWVPVPGFVGNDTGIRTDSYEINDVIVEFSDVRRAWERLPLTYRRAIFERYGLGEMPEGEAAVKREYRAVVRLTDLLNSYYPRHKHDGPGSRKVMSSAHEQYIIRVQDEGTSNSPSGGDRWG